MRLCFLAVLALPLLPGCIAAAGVGAGALATHELLANEPRVAHVYLDVEEAWPATIAALRDMGATDVDVQNYPRVVTAAIYKGDVAVKVEAYDIDRTVISLQFRKNGLIDNHQAGRILEQILDRFDLRPKG